ncbi:Filamentous hemagglutinin family outer membrane protein [Yersinia rohdei ATCC 43380]|nr:Filamentous hemagglutinin family outer membrane protein [Yersinia rohdei ATCC 43380]
MEKMVLVLVSERDLHGDGAACQPMLPVKKMDINGSSGTEFYHNDFGQDKAK